MNVAVIGSGIGGLATSVRLAAAGHRVTVYEKNETPGGKISELRVGDYRFDTGPSLFTLPELVEELFTLCGERMEDHIPHSRLETNCKYFYPDGENFTFYHNHNLLKSELEEKNIIKPEAIFKRLDRSRQVYELSAPVFLFSNFHKLSNFNTPPYRNIATKLYKLDFARTMHGANKKDFSDERLVRIFDRYATYNGSSPYKAPATLNMIAHLENNIGAYFPRHGMYSIIEQIYRLALRQGVRFRFGEAVQRIVTDKKSVSGVESSLGTDYYDTVISDVDVRYLSEKLLPENPLRSRLRRVQPSSSALIFYWPVRGIFEGLELHNILFSKDYKSEFKSIFRDKTIPDDPTIYIFISSKIVPEDAPEGSENWFVMVNAPSDSGQNWEELVKKSRENIIRKIDRTLGVDIQRHICGGSFSSPQTIEHHTSSAGGALYGASSNSMLSAFMRHPNHLGKFKNLYFVGGSVHPGGGIPLCLASSKIVCDEICSDGKTN